MVTDSFLPAKIAMDGVDGTGGIGTAKAEEIPTKLLTLGFAESVPLV